MSFVSWEPGGDRDSASWPLAHLKRQSCPYLLPSAAFPSILVFFLHLSTGLLKPGSPGNQGKSDRECGSQQKLGSPCTLPFLALPQPISILPPPQALPGGLYKCRVLGSYPEYELNYHGVKLKHCILKLSTRYLTWADRMALPDLLVTTGGLSQLLPPLNSLPGCLSLQTAFSKPGSFSTEMRTWFEHRSPVGGAVWESCGALGGGVGAGLRAS